jgi:DNA-binding NtrC family response regulator
MRNVAERALIVADGGRINLKDLPGVFRGEGSVQAEATGRSRPLKAVLEEAERTAIEAALRHTRRNKAKAAAVLGIHRTGLYQKMRKYNIL